MWKELQSGKVSKLLFCNIILIMDSGKSHHWRLKPYVKGCWETRYLHRLKDLKSTYINIIYFKLYKGKVMFFLWGRSGKYHLIKWPNLSSPIMRQTDIMSFWCVTTRSIQPHHVVLLPKLSNLNYIIGNRQIYKNILQHNHHVQLL